MRLAKRYTPGLLRKKCGIRFWMYFIAIMIGIYLFCGKTVYASLGYYEVQDLYQYITDEVTESNDLLVKAFKFTQESPYTILNKAAADTQNSAKAIQEASKTAALAVATLLLMVEFFRKSITFEWSSKWENILIFLIKVLVVKQIVQNSDTIMGYIYAGFNSINLAATGGDIKFLPCTIDIHYRVNVPYRGDTVVEWVYSNILHKDIPYDYYISTDAVKMFYANPQFLATDSTFDATDYPLLPPVDNPAFTPILEKFILQPYFLIMKIIAVMIFVITIGRVFELTIYTLLAPLPLATFASEVSHDVGRNFLKNYIAVVLQITVIVTMFIAYSAVQTHLIATGDTKTLLIRMVTLISLATGVIKSGTWSKRICGIS